MSENGPPQDRPYPEPPNRPYAPPPGQAYPPPPEQAYAPPSRGGQYPTSPYASPVQMRDHPQATLAFVLGLLSVLGLSVFGPFGWYYGRKVVREIDRDPGSYANRGLAMAGMVLGIIGTAFLAIAVLLVVAVIVVALLAAGSVTPRY